MGGPGAPDIGKLLGSLGGGQGGTPPNLSAMMNSMGAMFAPPARPQTQPAPVPRVVPTSDQKSEGLLLAYKDQIKQLSGVSFPPQAKRDGNQQLCDNLSDMSQHTMILLPFIQRLSDLVSQGKDTEELAKLKKTLCDAMEGLSRVSTHLAG